MMAPFKSKLIALLMTLYSVRVSSYRKGSVLNIVKIVMSRYLKAAGLRLLVCNCALPANP
jgi:hypothetical protein